MSKCTCGENKEEHPCPYAIDIHDMDEDDEGGWCSCCEYCTQQCAMDI